MCCNSFAGSPVVLPSTDKDTSGSDGNLELSLMDIFLLNLLNIVPHGITNDISDYFDNVNQQCQCYLP